MQLLRFQRFLLFLGILSVAVTAAVPSVRAQNAGGSDPAMVPARHRVPAADTPSAGTPGAGRGDWGAAGSGAGSGGGSGARSAMGADVGAAGGGARGAEPSGGLQALAGPVAVEVGQMGKLGRGAVEGRAGGTQALPGRMRQAVLQSVRDTPGLSTLTSAARAADGAGSGTALRVHLDGSVTRLAHRRNAQNETEIQCDVSLVVSALPKHNIVGMVSGGASVISPGGPRGALSKKQVDALEQEALQQAVQQAHASFVELLKKLPRR